MQLNRWQFVLARLFFLAYVLFTSTYCLLAYIPFTYQQVHVGGLLPRLTRLVHLHAALYWPFALVALLTILPDLNSGPARNLSRGFAVIGLFVGIALQIHPLLPGLSNDVSSLCWCILSLVPLLWLAAIDWLHEHKHLTWPGIPDDDSSKTLLAALWTAVFVAVIYFALAVVSARTLPPPLLRLSLLFWSLISHLLVFFLFFVLLDLVSALASLLSSQSSQGKAAFCGSLVLFIVLVSLALRYAILPSLSLEGFSAAFVSAAFAFGLVMYGVASSVRLWNPAQNSNHHAVDVFFDPFQFLQRANKTKQSIAFVILACLAWFLSIHLSRLDWDFMLQKIAVLLIWIIAFAIFYTITPPNNRVTRLWTYATGVLLLSAYLGLVAAQPRWSVEENSPTAIGQAIEEFQGYDISFRLADTLLRCRFTPRGGAGFYSFLSDNTNIPRSTHLSPTEINLVAHLNPSTGRKPNIFIFVIDSLRRDYVSPYNSAVTFTPALEALAEDKDTVVFQNAFTRYGGTGLSEPSIWVGGMMLHQQYISPFAPLNSLQKLLDANHYAEWISKDNILQQIVPPSPNINELDANIGAMHYDLCQTLRELTQRLQFASPSAGPIFVYTQPQNIHVSVIDREGRSVPDGARLPAQFDAAYASRVQKLDACLGEFLTGLKKNGLYDNSLIIVTSDHGDSLGEHGRWGHAYTLFPEIVRIPLIVHLPPWMLNTVKYDPKSVAFLTDLTPSLYYLLGQKAVANNPLFGRPLFTGSLDEQQPYSRDSYLLASSYAPVYGLLSNSGRSLYIADGVNYRDYAYQLNPDGSSREAPLTDAERSAAQDEIRRQINAIARFYHLQ
jgi:glucan phosphoethanolaminetransferase (alkaline phosphatase superfamily)